MPIPFVSWEVGSSSFALLISALATLEISLVPASLSEKVRTKAAPLHCSGFFRQSALYPLAMHVAQLLDVLLLYPHICPHTEIVKALLLDRRGFWVDAGPFSSQTSVTAIADTPSRSRNNSATVAESRNAPVSRDGPIIRRKTIFGGSLKTRRQVHKSSRSGDSAPREVHAKRQNPTLSHYSWGGRPKLPPKSVSSAGFKPKRVKPKESTEK